MGTPKPPLTPQMQDALQRGDLRAMLQAARASAQAGDMQAARRAIEQQLRQQADATQPGLPPIRDQAGAALDAVRQVHAEATHVLQRKRPPTVQMGERPGEMRWLLIVAALLVLAAWLAFGG